MQKNWYAVYTKPQCEKKVAAVLTKWKIENFCPLKIVKINLLGRIRLQYEPLFKSYVFLYISKDQICRLDKISGVVNLLHWLGSPAVINIAEIEAMKEFTNNYKDIKLEKIGVNLNDGVKILDEPSYRREGKFISVKSKTMRINLPSLGYTLFAEIEKDNILERQHSLLPTSHPHLNSA